MERNTLPLLTALNHSEWRLCAWDMVLTVGDRNVARKLFKIIRWTYRASKGSVRLTVETSQIGYNHREVNQWYLTKKN